MTSVMSLYYNQIIVVDIQPEQMRSVHTINVNTTKQTKIG